MAGVARYGRTVRAKTPQIEGDGMTAYHEDKPRLAAQTLAIVERLRRGPATNDELSRMARKYTGRISDARKAGYVIDCERIGGGLTRYRLLRQPGQVPEQLGLRGVA